MHVPSSAETFPISAIVKTSHGNITINHLAAMSNIRQSTLDNIVRGLTKNPRVKTLHKIALAFNMTLAEFLDFSELNAYEFGQEDED